MDDKLKIYFYFVFGCIGGLTGWYFSASLLLSTLSILDQALFGAIIGAMIGLSIAAYEGFITRSFVAYSDTAASVSCLAPSPV